MYINKLNNEQKELFIDICIYAALANNEFADEEKEFIRQYCDEMAIENVRFTANLSFDDAVHRLSEISSNEELRIVVLEIAALLVADNEFDDLEKKFMDNFTDRLNINRNEVKELFDILPELINLYGKINKFVFPVKI